MHHYYFRTPSQIESLPGIKDDQTQSMLKRNYDFKKGICEGQARLPFFYISKPREKDVCMIYGTKNCGDLGITNSKKSITSYAGGDFTSVMGSLFFLRQGYSAMGNTPLN